MKRMSLILGALIALVLVFTSCGEEPQYYKPENPKYKVGDLIKIGDVHAVVFYVTFDGDHGKAVSVSNEASLQWSTTATINLGCSDKLFGKNNQQIVQNLPASGPDDWRLGYPVFWQCFNVAYPSQPIDFKKVSWYLPSLEEMKLILKYRTMINDAMEDLEAVGKREIRENVKYWTSTEADAFNAKICIINDGKITVEDKMKTNNDPLFRAVIDF
ncbi:MAG TPA: hypothetical protein PLH70_04520 [Bacteroidales bacterium]|nr:hypothetical protein [Bacteroidales bacterium]HOH22358.1 hypothetical protein [Bacteroidales bacterium]HPB58300.1 hypothetical protein [Bacteroidales bacterium]HPZ03021.1 hypothetical protein [Bacteroidales bacterium]HQB75046.1 hypothetical protein [Bacteroidales bacterium]